MRHRHRHTFNFGVSGIERERIEVIRAHLKEVLGVSELGDGSLGRAMVSILYYLCTFEKEKLREIVEFLKERRLLRL